MSYHLTRLIDDQGELRPLFLIKDRNYVYEVFDSETVARQRRDSLRSIDHGLKLSLHRVTYVTEEVLDSEPPMVYDDIPEPTLPLGDSSA